MFENSFEIQQIISQNKNLSELLLNGFFDGMCISKDGQNFWINARLKHLLGYLPDAEKQVDISNHLSTDDFAFLSLAVRERKETTKELEFINTSGYLLFFECRTVALSEAMLVLVSQQYPALHGELGLWIWDVENQRIRMGGNIAQLPIENPESKPQNFNQWLAVIDEKQRATVLESLHSMQRGNYGHLKLYHSFKTKSQHRYFRLTVFTLNRCSKGQATLLVGHYEDITVEKYHQNQQLLAEQMYSLLFNSINEGLLLFNSSGNLLTFNTASQSILGLSPAEMVGLSSNDSDFKLTDSNGTELSFRQFLMQKSDNEIQRESHIFSVKHKNQSQKWIRLRVRTIQSPDGLHRKNTLATIVDYSQSYLAEQKLSKTKELLDRSNKLARIGTWEINLKDKSSIWSSVTREIHEVEPSYAASVERWILFYKEGHCRARMTEALRLAIDKGVSFDEELQIVTDKGNTIWVRVVGLVEFEGGKCKRLFGTIQDINRRKVLEENLIEKNEILKATDEERRASHEQLILTKHELEESEAIMMAISDSFTYAIILVNTDLVVLYANQIAKDMYFGSQTYVHNQSLLEFIPKELKKELSYNVMRASNGEKIEYELSYQQKSFTNWHEVKLLPVRVKDGTLLGVVITISDITEKKLADLEFKRLAKEYEQVFHGTQDALFLIKVNAGMFTYLRNNLTHQRLTGLGTEDLRDKTPVEVVGEKLGKELEANYLRCWNSAGSICFEEELPLPAGTKIWRTTLTAVRQSPLSGYIIGSSLDITAEKKSEQQRLMLSERIEKIAQHLPGFIYQYTLRPDGSSYFPYVSSGVKTLGLDPEHLMQDGKIAFSNVWEADMDLVTESLQKSAQTLQHWQQEFRQFDQNKRLRWIMANASCEKLSDGSMTWYGFMYDITERKKNEQDIIELLRITKDQNQRLNEYAYITSHNIRSYVANLIGINNLLKENPTDGELLAIMDRTVLQLDDTIYTMNELLTLENEAHLKPREDINLLTVVNRNIDLIQNQLIQFAEIKIEVPADIHLQAIAAYLDSIITNLLTNAIKYRKNRQKAQIEVKAFYNKDEVVLIVSDKGIGIDLEKHKDRLFKMRSRFHEGTEGKGLGLFFTKRQVEAMGGSISVESKPNVGSIFTVRLKRFYS